MNTHFHAQMRENVLGSRLSAMQTSLYKMTDEYRNQQVVHAIADREVDRRMAAARMDDAANLLHDAYNKRRAKHQAKHEERKLNRSAHGKA